jgi:hypothetical protein
VALLIGLIYGVAVVGALAVWGLEAGTAFVLDALGRP